MQPIYFSELEKGSALPAMKIDPITRVDIVRFIAASEEFNPLYFDDLFARKVGKQGVIVPGTLIMSFAANMVSQWTNQAVLKSFSLHQTKLVRPDDALLFQGLVVDTSHDASGGHLVNCDVWAENDNGETVAKGRLALLLPYSKEKPLPKKAFEEGLPLICGSDKKSSSRTSSSDDSNTNTAAAATAAPKTTARTSAKKAPRTTTRSKKK